MGSGWSIRGRLFGLWLLMLIVVSMIVYWSTNAIVERSLREGQNRNLQAVAQVILDSAIKVDNAIEFELPYQAFEVLAYSAPERIYYAVFLDDEHLSGYRDLPTANNDELPAYERLYRGESTRFLITSKPIFPGSSERLRVLIGQTETSYQKQSTTIAIWIALAVLAAFAVLALQFPDDRGLTPASTNISLFRDLTLDLFFWGSIVGMVLFVLWVFLLVASSSNGVNIADGLDGLASGSAIFAIGAYVIIGFWQFNQSCRTAVENIAACYEVRDPLDVAVVAAAIVGACVGFLWWNTSPAQLFMGDTGSLGLGGALAALAVVSRTELLLILIGGIFVIVTGSVVIQRAYFKLTKKIYGKGRRVFRMSPLHHHFELKGWAEITIVVRFWIIAALCVAAGVGLFYVEWIYGL